MNAHITGVVCLILAFFAAGSLGSDKGDRLEGTWVVTGISTDGKRLPEKMVAKLQAFIVFKDGKIIRYRDDLTKPSDEKETSYKIDASKKPPMIDLIEKEGKVKPGIFELDGDNLRIASGDPRPKTFDDAKGVDVLTLKRKK